MRLRWKNVTAELADPRPGSKAGKSPVVKWYGGSKACPDLVTIQGPTEHNPRWRVMTYLRWKDVVVRDFNTLLEAKRGAQALVDDWLSSMGIKPC